MKTGCCRYGEACSKFHPYPDSSCTVLFRNMYSGIGMVAPSDEDGDIELQYDEKEIMAHFTNFWNDVEPEFEKFGPIRVMRVCRYSFFIFPGFSLFPFALLLFFIIFFSIHFQ